MNVIDLITVICFGITCFVAGYSIGKDKSKKQK